MRIVSLLAATLVAVSGSPAVAQIVRVSVATDGTEANGPSLTPSMSASGRFVAFVSFASNLVANDTNGIEDVFLRDRDTDADGVFDEAGAVSTVRVSERGGAGGNGPSHGPVLTPDGRYVVFTSFASSLFAVGQPPLLVSVVLRWDRLTGDIVLVSQTTAGEPLLAVRSVDPDVSDDGNQVVFTHGGSLTSESISGFRGVIYRRDIAAATLTHVSTVPLGGGPEFKDHNVSPGITGDGRTIVYGVETRSDLQGKIAGTVYLVDSATNEVRASYAGLQPRLSRDGAFLAVVDAQGESASGPAVRIHLASVERRSIGAFSINAAHMTLSPSGRYLLVDSLLVDFQYGSFVLSVPDVVAFDAADTAMAYAVRGFTPARTVLDVLVGPLTTLLDNDADGLNDHWEMTFGLLTGTGGGATGDNGPTGDPDGDGHTNLQEFQAGSSPTGSEAHYLAEGASGPFFSTRYAIANPTGTQVDVAIRFELDGGGTVKRAVQVGPRSRVTLDARAQGLGTTPFSAVVESNLRVVVDRLMTWGAPDTVPYGSHAETSSSAPGTSWFLAEGSTVVGFQLFYLLQNPQATPTTATIRYLLPSGAPLVRTYDLPARSRTTVYVNTVPGLEATDVSAEITATQPIAVERAMYRSGGGQTFALGHDAAAVAAPASVWTFAEGATGTFFDTYLLLANPSATAAAVDVHYLRDSGGPVTRTYAVPANGRSTIFVDDVPGLEAASFGIRVSSAVPIVAERAMYWSGGFFDYYEGHVSSGATQAGSRWVLAEGEELGRYAAQTFVLVANTGPAPATVVISSLPDGAMPAVSTAPIQIAPTARVTVPMATLAGFGRGGIEVVEQGTATGALVVEGAIYWNVGGVPFAAGANWPATRIP